MLPLLRDMEVFMGEEALVSELAKTLLDRAPGFLLLDRVAHERSAFGRARRRTRRLPLRRCTRLAAKVADDPVDPGGIRSVARDLLIVDHQREKVDK